MFSKSSVMDTMLGQQWVKSLWFLFILRFYLMANLMAKNAFFPVSGPFLLLLSFCLELHFFCFLHRSNNRNLYCCHLIIISSKKVILRTQPKEHATLPLLLALVSSIAPHLLLYLLVFFINCKFHKGISNLLIYNAQCLRLAHSLLTIHF